MGSIPDASPKAVSDLTNHLIVAIFLVAPTKLQLDYASRINPRRVASSILEWLHWWYGSSASQGFRPGDVGRAISALRSTP